MMDKSLIIRCLEQNEYPIKSFVADSIADHAGEVDYIAIEDIEITEVNNDYVNFKINYKFEVKGSEMKGPFSITADGIKALCKATNNEDRADKIVNYLMEHHSDSSNTIKYHASHFKGKGSMTAKVYFSLEDDVIIAQSKYDQGKYLAEPNDITINRYEFDDDEAKEFLQLEFSMSEQQLIAIGSSNSQVQDVDFVKAAIDADIYLCGKDDKTTFTIK